MITDTIVFLSDDDEVNNYLSREILEEFLPADSIHEFTSPEEMISRAGQLGTHIKGDRFIFFVDINMPGCSGWELVRRLKELPGFSFQGKDKIYILSSSINPNDRNMAGKEAFISGFLEKPLTSELVSAVLDDSV